MPLGVEEAKQRMEMKEEEKKAMETKRKEAETEMQKLGLVDVLHRWKGRDGEGAVERKRLGGRGVCRQRLA